MAYIITGESASYAQAIIKTDLENIVIEKVKPLTEHSLVVFICSIGADDFVI